jgi:hypothetical protein
MFGHGFEQATILRTGPDGLTRVITRTSWDSRESVLVEARQAELFVFRRWEEFHEKALGFRIFTDARGGGLDGGNFRNRVWAALSDRSAPDTPL